MFVIQVPTSRFKREFRQWLRAIDSNNHPLDEVQVTRNGQLIAKLVRPSGKCKLLEGASITVDEIPTHLMTAAQLVFNDEVKTKEWLSTPLVQLNNQTPLEHAKHKAGYATVLELLNRMARDGFP